MYEPRRLVFQNTTPLNLGVAVESKTTVTIDGKHYVRITGKVYSDVAGSLEIQQADPTTGAADTVGTFRTLSTVAVAAATPTKFDEILYCRFVNLKYTNGGTNQATFEISAYLAPVGT